MPVKSALEPTCEKQNVLLSCHPFKRLERFQIGYFADPNGRSEETLWLSSDLIFMRNWEKKNLACVWTGGGGWGSASDQMMQCMEKLGTNYFRDWGGPCINLSQKSGHPCRN